MLMESGVKDAVPAGRKYKPIPRQAGDPSQEESLFRTRIQLPP